MKHSQIAARIIRRAPGGVQTQEAKHERMIYRAEHARDLKSRAERLAGHNYCVMNWKWKGSEEAFPNEPWLRSIGKFYPHALGGPLLVDEPLNPEQIKQCERKRPYLEKQGYCYLVLKPSSDAISDQLELQKCRGRVKQWQSHH